MQKPTVLIIEDDAIARLSVNKIIGRDERLAVLDAGSGAEALELSERFRIDLVIADIILGAEDGIAVAQQVLARHNADVIFLSAVSDVAKEERATALKPRAFLQKPVDEAALQRAVEEALAGLGRDQFAEIDSNFVLDTLYDTAKIGMCITDEHRRFVRVNRAYSANYGYPARQLIGNEFTMVLPEEDRAYAADVHDQFIAGTISEMPARWRVQTSDGQVKNIYVTAGRMIGKDGKTYKVTTVSDITAQLEHERELEEAIEEKKVLLREVHHRVKNNLNTLSSLLHLQRMHNSSDPRAVELLTVTINRVKTMSSIYERLHEADRTARIALNDYLSSLTRDLVQTSEDEAKIDLSTEVEPIEIDIDHAISVGLIVNELVTNCVKHAFADRKTGKIELHLTTHQDEITITVADDGPGLPEGFSVETSNSLGLQLIQAIVGQRNGTLAAESTEKGARFTATMKYDPL